MRAQWGSETVSAQVRAPVLEKSGVAKWRKVTLGRRFRKLSRSTMSSPGRGECELSMLSSSRSARLLGPLSLRSSRLQWQMRFSLRSRRCRRFARSSGRLALSVGQRELAARVAMNHETKSGSRQRRSLRLVARALPACPITPVKQSGVPTVIASTEDPPRACRASPPHRA